MAELECRVFARFWAKVERGDLSECWIWLGATTDGYGTLRVGSQMQYAHRWLYAQVVQPIPPGLQLDHLCRNRACVRPSHLELVTQRENLMRGMGITAMNLRKTHCDNGHFYDEKNTYLFPNGARKCRLCKRESDRRRRARLREAAEEVTVDG